MVNYLRNMLYNRNRYRSHPEAVVISCYYNPTGSPYRLKAFNKFYSEIKHLNHLIVECVIGETKPQLPDSSNIQRVYTDNLLWHKESLLNLLINKLSPKLKYVFWLDADVTFTNLNWLVDSVAEFKAGANILQPFEYCVHLDKDEVLPNSTISHWLYSKYGNRPDKVWRSFCANFVDDEEAANSPVYNTHGHVGFAWAARREILQRVPLYDRALIGGADHIIAHAAANQIPCPCINKSFTGDLDSVYEWSKRFAAVAKQKIAYVKGNLYHTWHGDIERREYLKRVQEFTPETKQITQKDANGLYVTGKGDNKYVKDYFHHREVGRGGYHTTSVQHHHYYHPTGSGTGPSAPVVKPNSSGGYDDAAENFS